MIPSRIAWAAWALVPVAAVAYHFGPGQAQYALDRTATLQDLAIYAQADAQSAQDLAYAKHLEALDARRAAIVETTPTREAAAVALTKEEDALYHAAAAKWAKVADCYANVLTELGDGSDDASREIRWAKAHATVRSGDIWAGIGELEGLIDEVKALDDATALDARSRPQILRDQALETAAREELATAYYYGARLLRLSGMPAQEWRVESGKARQHFRFLAESEGAESDGVHQRNLELVLNLEQAPLADLQGKALPKDCPGTGSCNQQKRGACKKPGKKPGLKPNKDARGAGGVEAITDGW